MRSSQDKIVKYLQRPQLVPFAIVKASLVHEWAAPSAFLVYSVTDCVGLKSLAGDVAQGYRGIDISRSAETKSREFHSTQVTHILTFGRVLYSPPNVDIISDFPKAQTTLLETLALVLGVSLRCCDNHCSSTHSSEKEVPTFRGPSLDIFGGELPKQAVWLLSNQHVLQNPFSARCALCPCVVLLTNCQNLCTVGCVC